MDGYVSLLTTELWPLPGCPSLPVAPAMAAPEEPSYGTAVGSFTFSGCRGHSGLGS